MKIKLPLLAGFASLAALIGAHAQTAVTDPVGYITVNVEGQGSTSLNTFTAISPTLVGKVEFSGAITAISATSMTVSGAPFTANAFATLDGTATGSFSGPAFWVEVTSGGVTKEGAWTNITANTTNSITLSDDMTAFASIGSTIKIRKHVTLGEYLGNANTAGFKTGADPGLADTITFIEPGAPNVTVFHNGTSWVDGDEFLNMNNKAIEPGQGLLVTRTVASDLSFVFTGHVKTGQTMMSVRTGNNVLPVPHATGTALGTSNLANAGSPTTGLRKGGDPGLAETVTIFDPVGGSANVTYFPTTNAAAPFWQDGDNFDTQDATVIKEGQGLYIVREGPDFIWTAPAQVIAP